MKILGLMSGTSFDGVDAALLRFVNKDFEVLQHEFVPYSYEERVLLRKSLGQWEINDNVTQAIHAAHNRVISKFEPPDLVGFHGQTLAHDPINKRSYQAGDPSRLQVNCPVIYDFRQTDLAMGGEGAPLMPIYHQALIKRVDIVQACAIINIGGVSNLTYIDPNLPPEVGLLAGDCGPGNALSDDLIFAARGLSYDEGGALAQTGQVNEAILGTFKELSFFVQDFPKSLDRDAFSHFIISLQALTIEDALATANAMTLFGLQAAIKKLPQCPKHVYIAGGGRHNPFYVNNLDAKPIEALGLNGDMIEAEGFAYLAWLYWQNKPSSFSQTTGAKFPVINGKIYRP